MGGPKYKFRHPKYKFRHPEYSGISSDTQSISSDTQSISSDTQSISSDTQSISSDIQSKDSDTPNLSFEIQNSLLGLFSGLKWLLKSWTIPESSPPISHMLKHYCQLKTSSSKKHETKTIGKTRERTNVEEPQKQQYFQFKSLTSIGLGWAYCYA